MIFVKNTFYTFLFLEKILIKMCTHMYSGCKCFKAKMNPKSAFLRTRNMFFFN